MSRGFLLFGANNMYEIKAATVLQDTNKVSFLPNVPAGEHVIILGENSVESGVYTRTKARGALERNVPVGAGVNQTFWSRSNARLETVTGIAGKTLRCAPVRVTTHYASYYGGHAVFTAPHEMVFDPVSSIIPTDALYCAPCIVSSNGDTVNPIYLDSRIVLERGDTINVIVRSNTPVAITLVFHVPIW